MTRFTEAPSAEHARENTAGRKTISEVTRPPRAPSPAIARLAELPTTNAPGPEGGVLQR
jgi:hypothetical protein